MTISKGQGKTVVPKLRGLTLEQAKKKLKKAHLTYKIQREESSKAVDTVLSQSVAKGKKVARGTAVKLTVSKQKKAEAVVTKKPAATVKPTQRSKKKKRDFVGVIQ